MINSEDMQEQKSHSLNVIIFIIGKGISNTSSIPGGGWLYFTFR